MKTNSFRARNGTAVAAAKGRRTTVARTTSSTKAKSTPVPALLEIKSILKTDLIIISTRGYTGLKHALLGSTAERVVGHAPCPVLVVREREREFVAN